MVIADDNRGKLETSVAGRERHEADDAPELATVLDGETGPANDADVVSDGWHRPGRAGGAATSRRRRTEPADGGRPASVGDGTGAAQGGGRRPDAGRAPGIELIDPEVFRRELGSDSMFGDVEDRPRTSREDEDRVRFLRRYADAPNGLCRRHLVADAGTVARLRVLKAEAPNAARAIDVVERAALLSSHARSPLRLPPVLVVGPPGTGKSRIARRLAETLRTTLTTIDGGNTNDRGSFVGHEVGYRGSGVGKIARALLDGDTLAPLVLVDELDKVRSYGHGGGVRPLDSLLALLEPTTARAFVDTYVGMPMRADGVLWLMTVNSVAGLPRPLLDRVVVVEMPRLGRAETRDALRRVLSEFLAEQGLPDAALGPAALRRLESRGLRQARRILSLALGPALAAGRPAPDAGDIAAACALIDGPGPRPRPAGRAAAPPRRPVGFVHFPR